MKLDKKVSDGEIKFVLAKRIGEVAWGKRVPALEIEKVLTTNGSA
jgi:3-dehydroquinate synthetase